MEKPMQLPIEKASYWLATRPPHDAVRLAGDVHADIAIIGGGFTGLWTAVRLKELAPEARIVLLEQAVLGYGGSGRNAGQVSGCLDHSHQKAIAHFGRDEAKRMAAVGLQNLDDIGAFFRQHNRDCDFARTGQLFVALTPAQVDDARESVAAATDLGIAGARVLSGDETRAELNSPLYLGGAIDPTWGIVNPIKAVDHLRDIATQQGVQIFEQTPVTALEARHSPVRVKTATGTVSADKVILAANAYSHHLVPRLLRRYIPLYDYVLVSEPLTPAQHAAIGWRNRQAVVDGRTFFNYYRLTADNRILWGTSEAQYYPRNRVAAECDYSEVHFTALRESFARHFPQIAELKFPYAWGGPIASTTRLTPFFGTLAGGRIHYGLGYTGLGVANSHLAGKILAHQVLGKPSPLLDLAIVRQPPLPYPPEPIRSWAVNIITRSLRRVDTGQKPNLILRLLDLLGIGFSS
jgi:glycine/D-amino acid oxidase-like deaminating enzyme